jgi:hypothetical protein
MPGKAANIDSAVVPIRLSGRGSPDVNTFPARREAERQRSGVITHAAALRGILPREDHPVSHGGLSITSGATPTIKPGND